MSKYIEHNGTVVSQVAKDKFLVKIEQKSACATCHAATLCSAVESKEKLIEAISTDDTLPIGASVTIYGRMILGYKALLLAAIIPLFISLTTLLIAAEYIENELITGLSALAILIPYYILLACFRSKIERQFVFYIKENETKKQQ